MKKPKSFLVGFNILKRHKKLMGRTKWSFLVFVVFSVVINLRCHRRHPAEVNRARSFLEKRNKTGLLPHKNRSWLPTYPCPRPGIRPHVVLKSQIQSEASWPGPAAGVHLQRKTGEFFPARPRAAYVSCLRTGIKAHVVLSPTTNFSEFYSLKDFGESHYELLG